MPAKNSVARFGKRFRLLNLALWKEFMKETGIKMSYKTFATIIQTNSKNIADSIINEPEGVQLPFQMGFIVVTKYKPRKVGSDPYKSKKLGRAVPFLNLHSFGYIFNIRWYKMTSKLRNMNLYYLNRARPLTRGVAKSILSGTQFFQWKPSDLWSLSKLDRLMKRSYKREE